MKKLACLALLSVLGVTPVISSADPIGVAITFSCPNTTGTTNVVANFGNYIAGFGIESIQNQGNNPVYFKSTALPPDVPAKLLNYNNSAADYSATTGQVVCSYFSNLSNEPTFSVLYALTNGSGGTILNQGNNFVTVQLPFGFKAKA